MWYPKYSDNKFARGKVVLQQTRPCWASDSKTVSQARIARLPDDVAIRVILLVLSCSFSRTRLVTWMYGTDSQLAMSQKPFSVISPGAEGSATVYVCWNASCIESKCRNVKLDTT